MSNECTFILDLLCRTVNCSGPCREECKKKKKLIYFGSGKPIADPTFFKKSRILSNFEAFIAAPTM